MTAESPTLAIVIPAYKARFLEDAIRSVLTQTNQNFRLYVCDDNSPHDLASIVHPLLLGTRHIFHRFDDNLGKLSLADHWTRCVHISSEPWIWLFSDDDLMTTDCVENFWRTARAASLQTTVYRFNTLTIDAFGGVVRVNPPHPQRERPIQFAYHRLRRERLSFVSEYIFKRTEFDRVDGFYALPAAWGSDDVSWILFSGDQYLITIPEGRVYWRSSEENISNQRGSIGTLKIEASLAYIEWLLHWASGEGRASEGLNEGVLRLESRAWFKGQLEDLQRLLSIQEIHFAAKRLGDVWGDSVTRATAILFLSNLKWCAKYIRRAVVRTLRKAISSTIA